MFEYIKNTYGVNPEINMIVSLSGEQGVITKDNGHYIGVNFDKDKAGVVSNVHPTDDNLVYTDKFKAPRKMTRSQANYQEYLQYDCNETFAEWMGFA